MHRSISVASTIVALALLLAPGSAGAAAPARTSETLLVLDCPITTTPDGSFEIDLFVPSAGEAEASFAYWEPGLDPTGSVPTWLGIASWSLRQDSPSRIVGGIDLYNEDPEPGSAQVAVDFASAGSATSQSFDERFGNSLTRMTTTHEPMTAVGSVTIAAGPVLQIGDCEAARGTIDRWLTQPDAVVADGSVLGVSCTWELPGLFVALVAARTPWQTEAGLFVETASDFYVGLGPVSLDETGLSGSVELIGGGVATADLAVGLSRTGISKTWFEIVQSTRTRVTQTLFAPAGTVSISLPGEVVELSTDDATCNAVLDEFHGVRRTANGPRPPAPANDTPAAAEPLQRSASAHTAGAVFEGEARSACLQIDGEFNPFVNTVWYTVVGTGRTLTLDTAGSDFDTGIAVYVAGPASEFTEIACSNDVALSPLGMSAQAKVSFATEAGVTYLVQAGGYISESGHLVVRAS